MERIKRIGTDLGFAYFCDPENIFYLTGYNVSSGHLIVEGQSARLFLDSRYLDFCKSKENCEVVDLSYFDKAILDGPNRVYVDGDKLSYNRFLEISKYCGEIVDVKGLRSVKDKPEKEKLLAASKLTLDIYKEIRKNLRVGKTELEIVFELELIAKRMGARKTSFDVIVAFGENSSYPHHSPTDRSLKWGDPVLIDMGFVLDNYVSDFTRSFFFGDSPPMEYVELEKNVLMASKLALGACKDGVLASDLDLLVRNFFKTKGLLGFCKHSLGHGIGLEIHESPYLSYKSGDKLVEGNVITVEPGLYIEGKFGYRHENVVEITKSSCVTYT